MPVAEVDEEQKAAEPPPITEQNGVALEERCEDTLYPGDKIEYGSPAFGPGDPRGLRHATIVSIDPDGDPYYPVRINSIEHLYNFTLIKVLQDSHGNDVSSMIR